MPRRLRRLRDELPRALLTTVYVYELWGLDPRDGKNWYPVPYTGATLQPVQQRMDGHVKEMNYPWGHFCPGVRFLIAWWARVRPERPHEWKIELVERESFLPFDDPAKKRALLEHAYWVKAGSRYGWTLNLYSPSGRSQPRSVGDRRGRLERHLWADCAGVFTDEEFDRLLRRDAREVRRMKQRYGWQVGEPAPMPSESASRLCPGAL